MFLNLPMPRHFIYGAENNTLSYLDILRKSDTVVTEIPASSHFPIYTNPIAVDEAIVDFIQSVGDD